MKKIILTLLTMVSAIAMNAQNENVYVGTKFTDNWSVGVNGGIITTVDDAFENISPTVGISVEKYITPWLGVAVDGKTVLDAPINTHVSFDAVNVSGLVKVNLVNMFDFDGTRKVFEPTAFFGLGWGHQNCTDSRLSDGYDSERNYMTTKAGLDLTFNLGKERALGFVVTPAIVFGPEHDGRLNRNNAYFEASAGIVYHFMTSNGTHSFKKAHLYDEEEVRILNGRINELRDLLAAEKAKQPKIVEKVVKETLLENTVSFALGQSDIRNTQMASVANVAKFMRENLNSRIRVKGYADKETGTAELNRQLSIDRANNVKNLLTSEFGIKPERISAEGVGDTEQIYDVNEWNRVAVFVVE